MEHVFTIWHRYASVVGHMLLEADCASCFICSTFALVENTSSDHPRLLGSDDQVCPIHHISMSFAFVEPFVFGAGIKPRSHHINVSCALSAFKHARTFPESACDGRENLMTNRTLAFFRHVEDGESHGADYHLPKGIAFPVRTCSFHIQTLHCSSPQWSFLRQSYLHQGTSILHIKEAASWWSSYCRTSTSPECVRIC
jgi:hypothetical protein